MGSKVYSDFLALVRAGIGHVVAYPLSDIDWPTVRTLAEQQGLYAVVLDGIEKLPITLRPPQVLLLEWIGEVLQSYEYTYEHYCKAIVDMAVFYNSHGYKMMVLKGYACSLDWHRPEHRPCGDIDIWLFGKQKEADALLEKLNTNRTESTNNFKVDRSHHHHTVFYWGEFMVENHYDFVNVHAHSSSLEMEKEFKELGRDDSFFCEINGEKVYLPSPNLHALFLIKHAVSHFASANINLRQVLDWAFFVEKHTKEIDWNWLKERLIYYQMKDFVNCLNAICVEELGFDAAIFHGVQFNPSLKRRILEDILIPTFGVAEPKHVIPRLIYKYRRWKGNAWKQELCYEESRKSVLWHGIWWHLLKPASI